MELSSPAKINLYFRVLKKRPDGFHEIESLYQAIDLCDTLKIEASNQDSIKCNDPQVPVDDSNLILKAARLFRKKTNTSQYFSFTLSKNIPMQAGLGGGSSNAATTLWGLNQLLETNINDETLAKWGAELGSDVSFFLSSGRAYCTGRGEILKPANKQETTSLWIAKPKGEGLSTPLVYQHTKIENLSPSESPYFNDLEVAAFALKPELKQIKQNLKSFGFEEVSMTGSGTAFFCLGNTNPPKLETIDFFPVKFLYRSNHTWY